MLIQCECQMMVRRVWSGWIAAGSWPGLATLVRAVLSGGAANPSISAAEDTFVSANQPTESD